MDPEKRFVPPACDHVFSVFNDAETLSVLRAAGASEYTFPHGGPRRVTALGDTFLSQSGQTDKPVRT